MADPIVNLPGEVWKPVVGYEGLYEVSSMGRFFVHDRIRKARNGKPQHRQQKLLRPTVLNTGYLQISLTANEVKCRFLAHRLVLEAFIGPCPNGMECCHSDGNRANNKLENLRWDTKSANQQDRLAHGTSLRGQHFAAKLNPETIRKIRRQLAGGVFQRSIAAEYGVSQTLISAIATGKAWGWVAHQSP